MIPPANGQHYTILTADSFALLRAGELAADHVLTDPPYDSHCQRNQCSGSYGDGRTRTHVPRIKPEFAALTDYAFTSDLVQAADRWVLIFGTDRACGEIARVVGDRWVKGAVWYKPNSMGQLTRDRPASACEYIAIAHAPGKIRWSGHGSYGFWQCSGTRGEKERHPNQKPLALLVELIRLFTDPGDVILDPFCGGGRIGEAALLCGRDFIGIDSDEYWSVVSRRRCAHAEARYGVWQDVPELLHATRCDNMRDVMASQSYRPYSQDGGRE